MDLARSDVLNLLKAFHGHLVARDHTQVEVIGRTVEESLRRRFNHPHRSGSRFDERTRLDQKRLDLSLLLVMEANHEWRNARWDPAIAFVDRALALWLDLPDLYEPDRN